MDVYELLRQVLDAHPTGCPEAPEIIEILQILFTEEEAKTATGLGFKPFSAKTVAKRAGVSEEEATANLKSISKKGMAFTKDKEGVPHYALVPIMPGIFEFPFMKGKKSETLDRLAGLWHSYIGLVSKGLGSPSMALSRIIPINTLVESQPDVLSYERIDALIDQAKSVGIAHCACRESEQNCDAHREACMLFDATCDFLVERGFARRLTREEMKAKLKEFDELGLIHQVNNSQNGITFICNCCTCCCGLLGGALKHGNPYVFNPSGFIARYDHEKCTACRTCVDQRCHLDALEFGDDGPAVNDKKCIGCGLCVTGCPEEAMFMIRRKDAKAPAPTGRDIGVTVLSEKGKLERFMDFMDEDVNPWKY